MGQETTNSPLKIHVPSLDQCEVRICKGNGARSPRQWGRATNLQTARNSGREDRDLQEPRRIWCWSCLGDPKKETPPGYSKEKS